MGVSGFADHDSQEESFAFVFLFALFLFFLIIKKRMLNILNKTNADMAGFLNLSRDITEWGWYKDTNTFRVFMHLLFKANWKDGEYLGHKIERGQLVTGRKELAEELGLSERNIRTAIEHLKSTNEVAIKSTNKFSIITICKYNRWIGNEVQSDHQNDQQNDQQPTNNRPATDQQPTTSNNNNKEINKENNKDIPPYIPPQSEVDRLQGELAEIQHRLFAVEEQNNSLKEENEKLKSKKSKKKVADAFDVMADLSYVEPEYFDLWTEWLRYKSDIKDQYKTSDGVIKGYNYLKDLAGGDIDRASAIVDQSIRKGWKGLFDVKDWQKPQVTQQVINNSDGYNWQS